MAPGSAHTERSLQTAARQTCSPGPTTTLAGGRFRNRDSDPPWAASTRTLLCCGLHCPTWGGPGSQGLGVTGGAQEGRHGGQGPRPSWTWSHQPCRHRGGELAQLARSSPSGGPARPLGPRSAVHSQLSPCRAPELPGTSVAALPPTCLSPSSHPRTGWLFHAPCWETKSQTQRPGSPPQIPLGATPHGQPNLLSSPDP